MTKSKPESFRVGVQQNGCSPAHIKQMAWRALRLAVGEARVPVAADIGGGRGELACELANQADVVLLLDYSPPQALTFASNVTTEQADLNSVWPVQDESIDFAFALEVIEHLENPRHFFRELTRIVTPGGYAFVSTPNNHSFASAVTFLLRGQHRLFQEPSYPAHITPLLLCDFDRIASEVGLQIVDRLWSNHDSLPRLHWRLPFGGRWFSDTVGVLLSKPQVN